MNVTLLAYTPQPEKVVAAAAKLCYSNAGIGELLDSISDGSAAAFLQRLSDYGHQSPAEHVSFTFGIEGISRACLAQLTRHRLASFSVQSQRYVNQSAANAGGADAKIIVPPSIAEDGEASEAFAQAVKTVRYAYDHLHKVLEDKFTYELTHDAFALDEDTARKKAKKLANEDARFILPEGSETRLIVTMNARELNHFFKLRCCNRAQWEIRAVADEMLKLVYPIAPNLFKDAGPGCVAGKGCTEGSMSCGYPVSTREKYKKLKEAFS